MTYHESPRRKAQLFFSSHRDGFVHGTKDWKSWLSTSLHDQLLVVKLLLPNGREVFSTFSLKPALPSGISKRGLRRDQYLEVDPVFAKYFQLQEGEEVVVESVKRVQVAHKITVALENANDYEVMELNQEKMAHDILDQIRVVSSSYPFPIWINNQPIILRLVSSDPLDKWVLIVRDTYVEFHPPSLGTNSALSTPTTSSLMSPLRTPSGGSTYSEINDVFSRAQGHHQQQQRPATIHTSQPRESSHLGHRPSLSDPLGSPHPTCAPTGEYGPLISSQNESYGILPQIMHDVMGYLFRPGKEEQRTKPRLSQELSPSKTYHPGMVSQHVRQQSWHSLSQKEEAERHHYPLYISTPEFNAPLRVQSPPGNEFVWDVSQCFDVFVHPVSLPDLYNFYITNHTSATNRSSAMNRSSATQSHEEISFLIQLSVDGCSLFDEEKTDTVKSTGKPSLSGSEKPDTQTQEVKSDEPERDMLVQMVSGLWKGFTGQTQSAQADSGISHLPPQGDQPPATSRNRVAVARLVFATKVQLSGSLQESLSRQSSSESGYYQKPGSQSVAILPGHVLMSDLLRQQLGLKVNSLVRLLHVKEQWRILCNIYKVSVGLIPLTNTGIKERPLRLAFRQWVKTCQTKNPFGCVFSDNMVVPLPQQRLQVPATETFTSQSSDLTLCRVVLRTEISSRDRGKQRDSSSPDPPVRFLQLSLNDLEPRDKKGCTVNIALQGGGGDSNGSGLLNLKDMGPKEINVHADQLGAMDRYVLEGMDYVAMAISCRLSCALLICSSGGGTGGCGKTSLAKLLCQKATKQPLCAHPVITYCTLLRGKRIEALRKKLKEVREEAALHQPAIVVLDDLDQLAEQVSDIQKDAAGEGMSNTRTAQVILEFLTDLYKQQLAVVVIATAESRATVHPLLLQSRGKHMFDKIIEIAPPTLDERQEIVKVILRSYRTRVDSFLTDSELRSVVLHTEGYQAGDLVSLVNRAISLADQQMIRSQAATRSSPHHQHSLQTTKKDSVATVISVNNSQRHTQEQKRVHLTAASFHDALEGFVPSSLRGLSLHKRDGADFSHVGGLAVAKTTLRETLQWPSKYPKLFSQCPIKQHAGILLYGAPGTGKTLLAGAVAREFGLNFVSINGPELLNKYIGASEQAVRDLFGRAQAARPCILFFDEFDSLAPPRGHDRTGVTDRVVNQLLTQLDGVELLEGVYVLAATSRPDLIDPALLRPGRIDKTLFCDLPSQEEREEILDALGRSLPLSDGVSLPTIAAQTENFTGADLKALLYNAQLLAANEALQTRKAHSGLCSTVGLEAEHKSKTIATISEDGEVDSGFHGNRNSTASSVSSSTSERTHTGSQKTDSHSTSGHIHSRTEELASKEGMWEFHMSGEYVKQEIAQLPKEFEKLLKATSSRDDHIVKEGEQDVLKCEITMDQLQKALANTKPSLVQSERERYRKIFNRFVGATPVQLTDYKEQRITHA